jgi:hypothetical protein
LKVQNPEEIFIKDGQLAVGKEIHATFPKANMGADIILKGLERFREDQQPGESVTLQCRTVLTEKGGFTDCQVSLKKFDTY